jgi:hypothetical protein
MGSGIVFWLLLEVAWTPTPTVGGQQESSVERAFTLSISLVYHACTTSDITYLYLPHTTVLFPRFSLSISSNRFTNEEENLVRLEKHHHPSIPWASCGRLAWGKNCHRVRCYKGWHRLRGRGNVKSNSPGIGTVFLFYSAVGNSLVVVRYPCM